MVIRNRWWKKIKLTDNLVQSDHFDGTVWINNHQFMYSGMGEKIGDKPRLFLYDIETMQVEDLDHDGYFLGAVTPEGKKIALGCDQGVILYYLITKVSEMLIPQKVDIRNMIWVAEGRGFLYSDVSEVDFYTRSNGIGGLYYYSLEKKRSGRIMNLRLLVTAVGFVLPKDRWNRKSTIPKPSNYIPSPSIGFQFPDEIDSPFI